MNRRLLNVILSIVSFLILWPGFVRAQEAVTLSISPSLYEMSAEPGQEWRSSLKVVNVNKFDLTVYAEVVNFAPRGEGGDGTFIPINSQNGEGVTLAEWFTITNEAITIPREQSVEIPFAVRVPADASPGGHFAAILIGTKPIEDTEGRAKLQTAQMVTSLFFARVAGEVVEHGLIREFTTTKSLLGSPEATFSLRFENKGNVHLQPQGEIKIYNMWGEERGIIPINQYSNFGNVLPESIRKFLFTWRGEWSMSDIGRYTAVATLGYGIEEKQFTSSETIFWVLPIKLLLGIVLGLVTFIGTLTWLVRMYVRHMLVVAGIDIEDYNSIRQRSHSKVRVNPARIHAPVQAGILDLTKRMQTSGTLLLRMRTLGQFILTYKLFFLALALVLLFIAILAWYVQSANTEHRAYEVVYMQNENSSGTTLSSEEILYNQMHQKEELETTEASDISQAVTVAIVNRSGEPGAGAKTRLLLEENGYVIQALSADFTDTQDRTVIIATADQYERARALSELLGNAPVSIGEPVESGATITVFVGSDTVAR